MSQLEVAARGDEAIQGRIVSGTKTLDHLLPDLIFPIDREYTQTFFEWTSTFHNDESCKAREVDLPGCTFSEHRKNAIDNSKAMGV